jgi:hypothetical protein
MCHLYFVLICHKISRIRYKDGWSISHRTPTIHLWASIHGSCPQRHIVMTTYTLLLPLSYYLYKKDTTRDQVNFGTGSSAWAPVSVCWDYNYMMG